MLNCKIVALDFSCENARSQIVVWKKAAAQMLSVVVERTEEPKHVC